MSRLIADFFVSLDGFASREQEGQRWLFDHFEPKLLGYMQQVLLEPQTLVMGRRSYAVMADYWMASSDPQARPMNDHPKLVFSTTLEEPLAWTNARLARRPLVDEIRALGRAGGTIRTIGSLSLVKQLIDLELVDRLRLLVFPEILGTRGTQPIYRDHPNLQLKLVGHSQVGEGVLCLEYEPRRIGRRAS